MNRRDTLYSRFPPVPAFSYELDPERGYFSVVMPEATTNLITNPSVELNLTGYNNPGGSTVAATNAWQAYGATGLSVTPAVSTESGIYYGTISLVSGTTYTFSVTIQGEEGRKYFIYFATNAGALIGSKRTWIGTGRKQRIWVTYTETSSTTRRFYVTRDAYADQHVWYADGFQVEAKSYPTTYCDGDQKGFVINQAAYLWTGTPHVSTSTRSAQTRAGGREVSLLSLGFRILSIIGLGMAPLIDQSLAIPGQGELYQGTGTTAREFVLGGTIFGDGPGPRHLQSVRDGLINAFKPDAVSIEQPLLLRYQALDDDGNPCSDTLDLVCTYQGALEGNWNNHQREDIGLQFKMHLPFITNQYANGASLGFTSNLANANYLVKRTIDGSWGIVSSAWSGVVRDVKQGLDGTLYIGGSFANVGDANGDNIVKVATDGTISSMGTGLNLDCRRIAIAPNGDVYVGGDFTSAGGVANTARIARWDGAAWNSVGGGIASGIVNDLVFDGSGNLYIGGSFTNHFDANGDAITKWDGANYSSLGLGKNNPVRALLIGADGYLYAGGTFTDGISKWDGSNWISLGTFVAADVRALALGLDGSIYAGGGILSSVGGVTIANIAKWNGVSWSPLGSGLTPAISAVQRLVVDRQGNLLAIGTFTTAGGRTLLEPMAIWNGSVWLPVDIDLPGSPAMWALSIDSGGTIYFGFDTNGTATIPSVTSVTVEGSSSSYPVFKITGPGVIFDIRNNTTGKSIFFNLTLLVNEVVTLNLDPQSVSMVSNIRGNLLSKVITGSNLDLGFTSGTNDIAVYMPSGTTAATNIKVTWKNRYWSLDGAVVK